VKRAGGTAPPANAVVGAVCALLVGSCMWLNQPEPPPPVVVPTPPSDYEIAVGMLERDDVVGAERVFRQIASSCASGVEGEKSLLFLSTIWLDRHPQAGPDSAAVLAARFLGLPGADLLDRSMARTIYLLALELGADPSLRPVRATASQNLALRFRDCNQPVPPLLSSLPELGREPLSATVRRVQAERDSLVQHAATNAEKSRELAGRIDDLEAQLRNSQAEIERLRRLLGGRDTATARPRP
jgi:hypothetical protein